MMILRGATILTMIGVPFVGDLAIENGKIKALGTRLPDIDAEVHNLSGCYIMPGLVDAHSHLGLIESGTRETDHNEKMDPISSQMRGLDSICPQDIGFAEARSFGITTSVTGPGSINLIGGTFAAVKSSGDTVEKMLLTPSVAMKMALGENPKFRYTEIGRSPKSRMSAAALIRETLQKTQIYARKKTQMGG